MMVNFCSEISFTIVPRLEKQIALQSAIKWKTLSHCEFGPDRNQIQTRRAWRQKSAMHEERMSHKEKSAVNEWEHACFSLFGRAAFEHSFQSWLHLCVEDHAHQDLMAHNKLAQFEMQCWNFVWSVCTGVIEILLSAGSNILDPAVHGRGRRRLIATLFSGWTSQNVDLRVETHDLEYSEFHSKNGLHNHGIGSEKRGFRPAPRFPPVYPNQLRLSHHESFGIS